MVHLDQQCRLCGQDCSLLLQLLNLPDHCSILVAQLLQLVHAGCCIL